MQIREPAYHKRETPVLLLYTSMQGGQGSQFALCKLRSAGTASAGIQGRQATLYLWPSADDSSEDAMAVLIMCHTGSKTAAGRDRIIPIPLLILLLVQSLCDGRLDGPLVATQRGTHYRLDTGRHTYTNLQKRCKVDAELMMDIMGHESYSTTVEHYHTTTDEDIARTCSAVEGLSRPA